MIIHEINTRGYFTIEVGTSREDFTITYLENYDGIQRKIYVEISFKNEKINFFTQRKVVYINMDSFENWDSPTQQNVTLDEYRTILFRVSNFFIEKEYIVQLKA